MLPSCGGFALYIGAILEEVADAWRFGIGTYRQGTCPTDLCGRVDSPLPLNLRLESSLGGYPLPTKAVVGPAHQPVASVVSAGGGEASPRFPYKYLSDGGSSRLTSAPRSLPLRTPVKTFWGSDSTQGDSSRWMLSVSYSGGVPVVRACFVFDPLKTESHTLILPTSTEAVKKVSSREMRKDRDGGLSQPVCSIC